MLAFTVLKDIKQKYSPSLFFEKGKSVLLDEKTPLKKAFITFLLFFTDLEMPDYLYPVFLRIITEPKDFTQSDTEDILQEEFSQLVTEFQVPYFPDEAPKAYKFLEELGVVIETKKDELGPFAIPVFMNLISALLFKSDDVPLSIWNFLVAATYNPNLKVSLTACLVISLFSAISESDKSLL